MTKDEFKHEIKMEMFLLGIEGHRELTIRRALKEGHEEFKHSKDRSNRIGRVANTLSMLLLKISTEDPGKDYKDDIMTYYSDGMIIAVNSVKPFQRKAWKKK